ncbi:MAG: hypothetical protein EOM03_11205 [Clostridia bacterium]|nr:hypothetical protein [Clostridia bacterium]
MRATKLTPQVIADAEKYLKAGNYAITVISLLSIGEKTWYRWLERGEKEKSGLYRDFYEAVKRGESVAEGGAVSEILRAGKEGNWQAFAWFLERKFPKRWGRKTVVVVDDESGSDPINEILKAIQGKVKSDATP